MIDEISFVLPAYNEEDNIGIALRNCKSVAEELTERYEIIVVDDGSTDKTKLVVEEIGQNLAAVRLIVHDRNHGVATATRTGFAASQFRYIFYTDSDNQFNIRELVKLIEHAEYYDFVVGYRQNRNDPIHRAINTFLYNSMIRLFFKVPIRDVNCAFKIMKREAVERLDVSSTSSFYLAEFVIRAHQAGMTFHEVPVSHYPRISGTPTGSRPSVISQELKDLFLFIIKNRKGWGR